MRTICTLLVLGLLTMAVPATSQADEAPDTKVSLRFENQDVVHVIQTIAKFGKANVIVSPKVKGTISVNLRDVSWKTALEVVVRTVGAELIEEDFGIFRVVPATDVAKSKVTKKTQGKNFRLDLVVEKEARQKLEQLLVDSKKRADELRAKLFIERGRLLVGTEETAEVEAKVREAQKAALQAAEKRAKAHAQHHVRLYTDLVMEDDGKGGQRLVTKLKTKTEPAVQMVQIYDVGDLETLNGKPIDIVKIIRGVMKGDGYLGNKPGILIVRGSQEVHERVNRVLTKLRSAKQPNAVIGLGGGAGGKRRPHAKKTDVTADRIRVGKKVVYLERRNKAAEGAKKAKVVVLDRVLKDKAVYGKKKGKAATAHKKATQPYVISLGTSDRVAVSRTAKGAYTARRKAAAHLRGASVEAQRKRVENLQRAAGYLQAAGDSAGATRVRTQAAAALQQLRQREVHAKSGAAHGEVRGSIDGLRREVHALRGEVRELTALVRRLLQQQK